MIPRSRRFREIDSYVDTGRYESAVAAMEDDDLSLYGDAERVLYYLDAGMLYHYAGEYEKSNQLLGQAERVIEDLFARSVSRAAASLLVNDNVLEYPGEDYEDIYINVFKALNFLALEKPDSAFVEIRRIDEKLGVLEDKYADLAAGMNASEDRRIDFTPGASRFYNSALARYLSMLMYRADGQLDEARIDLRKIEEAWERHSNVYDFEMPRLASNEPDQPTINIISFVGKCPEKRANTLRIRTEQNLLIIAGTVDRDYSAQTTANLIKWPGIQEGYHFKFQLPYMVSRESRVTSVSISIDQKPATVLHPIESIENIAFETYKVKEPLMYLKGITRTVIKGILAERAKREIEKRVDNPFLSLAGTLATDVATDASEMADLRLARYYPKEAHIAEIPVSSGTHKVRIEYSASNGEVIFIDDLGEVDVKPGELTLLESFFLN